MADETMYAQSEIQLGTKDGVKAIPVGTKVTKSELGDNWDQMVESGAIGPEQHKGAPPSGTISDTISAEEQAEMDAAIKAEEGSVRGRSVG